MEPITYLEENSNSSVTAPISKAEMLRWMYGTDIANLGAVHAIISNRERAKAIMPPLSFEEDFKFRLTYYERCFLENPNVEWADRSYPAGWTAASWISKIWKDPQTPKASLQEVKRWLASIYLKGDDRVKECLINATLEHLFEVDALAQFFKDWQDDPALRTAYEDGMLWSKHGGISPLSDIEGK